MYIDYLKQDYKDKSEDERKLYIERDKKCIGSIIREKIANDIDNIVERYYEFDDIGYIDINEKFLDLLKEAEQLYYFGYYVGTIALVGITAEEFCKYLVFSNNISDEEKQLDRINLLANRGIISSVQKNDLHIIRKIRNRCMHYNVDFKNLPENDLKNHAYKMVSLFKKCLKPMAKDADGSEVFLNSSPKEWTSIKDFVYRNRNVVCKQEKIDMQIRAGVEKLMFTSYYYIGEIDINTEHFKEMTVFDLNCGLPAVIDLTLPQAERIKNLKIQEGNIILASFIATVAETGLTEEWQLLNIHDTYHGVLAPEELDSIMQYFG